MISDLAGTGLQYWLGDDMAQWVQREYGKGEIDRAGQYLIPLWTRKVKTLEKLGEAYAIIENWRTSHAMPLLTFRMSLANRAKRLEPNAIIAQRLKRFVAIMNKLVREPNMKLSQMHDLGGCRAIVSDIATVRKIYSLYGGDCGLFEHGRFKCYDYIQNPKPDGYRGIHVVGRYEARAATNEPWNGQRIEIQLRTQLQHAFATTVETVTTFTKQPLKFGAGPDEWRRFFSLVGSAFAFREGTTLVTGVPQDQDDLIRELRELTRELKVRQRLRSWAQAITRLPSLHMNDARWLLLVLNLDNNTVRATGYIDRKEASEELKKIEPLSQSGDVDAVLVWVGSIKDLRRAYPNYYADTTAFLDALTFALQTRPNGRT